MARDALVVEGLVTIGLDGEGKFEPEGESPDISIFNDTIIENRFEKDYHRYMMPIASPDGFQGNRAAFVQLASPTLLIIVDWTISRWNEPPKIPDPNTGDAILLDEHYECHNLHLGAEGDVAFYRISGTYIYGCAAPSTNTIDDVVFPLPPWMQDVFKRTMSRDLLYKHLAFPAGYHFGPGTTPTSKTRPGPGIPVSETFQDLGG